MMDKHHNIIYDGHTSYDDIPPPLIFSYFELEPYTCTGRQVIVGAVISMIMMELHHMMLFHHNFFSDMMIVQLLSDGS